MTRALLTSYGGNWGLSSSSGGERGASRRQPGCNRAEIGASWFRLELRGALADALMVQSLRRHLARLREERRRALVRDQSRHRRDLAAARLADAVLEAERAAALERDRARHARESVELGLVVGGL